TTSELCRSLFVYTVSASPTLVALGKSALRACDALRVPFLYEYLARYTFYKQFCAGDSTERVKDAAIRLRDEKLGCILAYVKEEAEANEAAFERTLASTLETIDAAAVLPDNYCAIKLTALAPACVLADYASAVRSGNQPCETTRLAISALQQRLAQIMNHARKQQVRVLIDAEQDALQPAIDDIAVSCARQFNRDTAVCYNTYQLYLKSAPTTLQRHFEQAQREGWLFGAKLVRGAYIASEPRHLIHDTKAETDAAYDAAIQFLAPHEKVEMMIASHNAESLAFAATLDAKASIRFAQLHGMSGALSWHLCSLLGDGTQVYAYLPWGTVGESMKYLVRRADENASMRDRCVLER
ncbi:FAD-linked oxidoreductase-like protein, partial [Protomyces lactucae-debilis]